MSKSDYDNFIESKAITVKEDDSFRITDDKSADWALRIIAEELAECERIIALADDRINEIQLEKEAARKRFESITKYLKDRLFEYFDSVPHRKTKTTEKYRLLSGSLILKTGGIKPKPNKEKLTEWLAANGFTDYIKTEQSPRWGEFKKILDFSGGTAVVKETGEIVDGIDFEEIPDEFDVDIK